MHDMTKKTLRGVLALGLVFAASRTPLRAAAGPSFSGFVDTSYNYDFNKPAGQTTRLRSFDGGSKTDSFLLNAFQLLAQGDMKDGIGYVGKLSYGADASILNATPGNTGSDIALEEAYLTYKCPITGLQLKAGKFVTTEGIEVIESKDDVTITRGHLFSLAEPFTHVGAMVGYTFPKIVDAWVGLVNGWDVPNENNRGKTLLAKVGTTLNDKVSGTTSVLYGPEKAGQTNDYRLSLDTTWMLKAMDKLNVGLQANYGQEDHAQVAALGGALAHWYGVGVQPQYSFTNKLALGARYEWFQDLDGARTGTGETVVQNFTICPTYNLTDNLMARLEFRIDWASQNVYTNSAGVGKGEAPTASWEMIYKF